MTKRTVLIVDDDNTLVDVLSLTLTILRDINVEKASSGIEGIQKAEAIIPDLIIMDYKMPGMNGWDAAAQLKNNPKTSHIPIIGYTAWAGKEDIQRGIRLGLNEIITKPVDLDIWEVKLNHYLK
ncbi:MAG: response regulator [Candidatus Margulisbacteria bacterium]|nr:response regulator [Candidatus Margulisiibacteriota bacterium]